MVSNYESKFNKEKNTKQIERMQKKTFEYQPISLLHLLFIHIRSTTHVLT